MNDVSRDYKALQTSLLEAVPHPLAQDVNCTVAPWYSDPEGEYLGLLLYTERLPLGVYSALPDHVCAKLTLDLKGKVWRSLVEAVTK